MDQAKVSISGVFPNASTVSKNTKSLLFSSSLCFSQYPLNRFRRLEIVSQSQLYPTVVLLFTIFGVLLPNQKGRLLLAAKGVHMFPGRDKIPFSRLIQAADKV